MRVLFLIGLTIGLLASCKKGTPTDTTTSNPGVENAQTLEVQVVAIHDEAMPRMNEISHLLKQLRNIKSAVKETPEGKKVPPEGLDKTMESLKLAEQGMMDWMNYYHRTKPTIAPDQLDNFMKKQIEEVTKVKKDIDTSIADAQAWIAANTPPVK